MRAFLLILGLLFCSWPVIAHKPLETTQPATKEQPIIVHAHQQSWVAYNRLTGSNDVDYYLLPEVQKGEAIDVTLLIPVFERLVEYKPVLVLLGPGLLVENAGLSRKTIDAFLEIASDKGVVINGHPCPAVVSEVMSWINILIRACSVDRPFSREKPLNKQIPAVLIQAFVPERQLPRCVLPFV
ncbi:MAG: hypothetical protein GX050_01510 [Firmicutes bacterium]|nr:hypothetical protein [Bacillota bacterium]